MIDSTGQLFPWKEAMQFGLGTLKLPPGVFWSLTPRELFACMHANTALPEPSISRRCLEVMQSRYPDKD